MQCSIHRVVAVAALGLAATAAGAQTADEQSAYRAMIYTPVGGLPPLSPVLSLGDQGASDISLVGRLGHMSRRGGLSMTSYGIGVEVPRGRMRLGATLAYLSASCGREWAGDPDCEGDIMLGGSARTLLSSRPLGPSAPAQKGKRSAQPANETKLLIGFDGSVGYSPRQGQSAMALAAGIPTAIAFQSGTVRFTPFLTPGIGYGRIGRVAYEDETPTSHGAVAFMIGGGFGLEFGTSGIGANVGFQRVLKGQGGATQLGLGVTWEGVTAGR